VLGGVHPVDLLGQCYVGLVESVGIEPAAIESVVAGCVYQVGEQAAGITRNAWLAKGLPETTAATTVDMRCGSGQQAVNLAALQVAAGVHDVVVAAGVEHMGRVGFPVNEATQREWGSGQTSELLDRYALVPQGVSAELIADRWAITREEMDAFALRSHQLAAEATQSGRSAAEIVPVTTPNETVTRDQGIRPDTSSERLAALNPAFREGGRVTAGNSSQISDGASAVLLTTRAAASRLGLPTLARIVDQTSIGVDPITMLTGPIPATARILERNGLRIADLDVIEINEAFASVVLAWAREHDPDMTRVNPRGGAIALGHPLGASGVRLITTLVHELHDRNAELGLVTMCCAGGLGTGTLIQRL
jgi:acetyl-CoA acetyltransferase family protein